MDPKSKMTPSILEAFEDGIYVMNQDLKVEYMNSAMMADFGDGIGKKCYQLLNQKNEKCPMRFISRPPRGKTFMPFW